MMMQEPGLTYFVFTAIVFFGCLLAALFGAFGEDGEDNNENY